MAELPPNKMPELLPILLIYARVVLIGAVLLGVHEIVAWYNEFRAYQTLLLWSFAETKGPSELVLRRLKGMPFPLELYAVSRERRDKLDGNMLALRRSLVF